MARTAIIRKMPNGKFQYSVWDTKKGFIASGFRKTEEEANSAAKKVINAK